MWGVAWVVGLGVWSVSAWGYGCRVCLRERVSALVLLLARVVLALRSDLYPDWSWRLVFGVWRLDLKLVCCSIDFWLVHSIKERTNTVLSRLQARRHKPFTFKCRLKTYRGTSLIGNCPPTSEHRKALGIVLLQGPRRRQFLESEVPLYVWPGTGYTSKPPGLSGGVSLSISLTLPLSLCLSVSLSLSLTVSLTLSRSHALTLLRSHFLTLSRRPLSSEFGTNTTVRARFWPWHGKSLKILQSCSLPAQKRLPKLSVMSISASIHRNILVKRCVLRLFLAFMA